jgi:septal ring factor EnvC (AmiA/AmiB activator)
MASIDTFHQQLRDEIAAVEKEIQSHNQQVEALNQRLEGLKRADELFDSDQAAMAELLQAGMPMAAVPLRRGQLR